MDEFLRHVGTELGLSESVARQGAAVVFRHLVLRADRRDVWALCGPIEGLAQIAVAAERQGFEGRTEQSVEPVDTTVSLRDNLGKAGIADDSIGPFIEIFLQFLRDRTGLPIVGRLVAATPELQGFVARVAH